MFVKIVRSGPTEIVSVYECQRYEIRNFSSPAKDDPGSCLITMEGPGDNVIVVDLEKFDKAVYFMNDQGQTFDSMIWYDQRSEEAVSVPA